MFTHRQSAHTPHNTGQGFTQDFNQAWEDSGPTLTQITREGPWKQIHSSLTSWERSFCTGDPTIPWYHITFWSLTRL